MYLSRHAGMRHPRSPTARRAIIMGSPAMAVRDCFPQSRRPTKQVCATCFVRVAKAASAQFAGPINPRDQRCESVCRQLSAIRFSWLCTICGRQ